ncbi:ORMDL family protein [Nitzschia inconspicua]|uniref:ORMDL family protein n=1 Tax=Nitzschia inconspicua TaxID=303405 RepID=A0A9K3PFN9_9STRA|nr:ORMDL family protein [Nitzschia inconspicua]
MTAMAIPRTVATTTTTTTTSSSSVHPTSPPRMMLSNKHKSKNTAPFTAAAGCTYAPLNDSNNGGSSHSGALNSNNNNAAPMTPQRPRINSRDIPRSYAGLYGQGGDDLLPFELARDWHTDWLENGGFLLLGTYVGGIFIFQVVVSAILDAAYDKGLPLYWSWTVTNAVHCLLSTIYLHWLKGSLFDEQGEMAAMTLWEQLEGRSNTVVVKRTLTIVPTLLCYAACHFSEYSWQVCFWNSVLWSVHIIAKLPGMNGVRIFGINRTTGIDDEYEKQDENNHVGNKQD